MHAHLPALSHLHCPATRLLKATRMKTGTGAAINGGLDLATVQPIAEPVPVFTG
jgi:hypothetical protein